MEDGKTSLKWLYEELNKPFKENRSIDDIFKEAEDLRRREMIDFAFKFYYDLSRFKKVPENLISENFELAEHYFDKGNFDTSEYKEYRNDVQDAYLQQKFGELLYDFGEVDFGILKPEAWDKYINRHEPFDEKQLQCLRWFVKDLLETINDKP